MTPPIAIPVAATTSSAGAKLALRVPSRRRTTPFTSRRVVASTTQAANTGGSALPITTTQLAESSIA